MKTILVPTDFSQCAERALRYAVRFAQKADAEIVLVHSCDLLEPKFSRFEGMIKEHNSSIKKDLYSKLKALKESTMDIGSVNISEKLYEGDNITDCILKAAKDHHADLIVMGTEGASTIKKKLFGSNAADMINKSAVPVMTIPCTYEWAEPKNILIAVDDTQEDAETLKPVFEIAKLFGGRVNVAIFTEDVADMANVMAQTRGIKFIQYRLQKVFQEFAIEVANLSGADFHEAMQRYTRGKQIDILAMITHKRDFWQNIFNSSMTQKMSYHSSVPLLSLHSLYK